MANVVLRENLNSNDGVIINANIGRNMIFGENCLVRPGCIFRTTNYIFQNPKIPIRDQGHEIGDISIGNGCAVGAGAVVTKSFDDFTILAGVPDSAIGSRKT